MGASLCFRNPVARSPRCADLSVDKAPALTAARPLPKAPPVDLTSRSVWPPQVAEEDLQRVAQATGAQVQTTVNDLDPKVLGTCNKFEERQVFPLP